MAVGLQRLVRRAVLKRLKADTDLIALVPVENINASRSGWPRIALNSSTTQPRRGACVRGGAVTWDIHAFARARESDGQVVDTSEDHASAIGEQIERILTYNRLTLDGGQTARIRLTDIRLMKDAEPDAHHWFAQINALVLAE